MEDKFKHMKDRPNYSKKNTKASKGPAKKKKGKKKTKTGKQGSGDMEQVLVNEFGENNGVDDAPSEGDLAMLELELDEQERAMLEMELKEEEAERLRADREVQAQEEEEERALKARRGAHSAKNSNEFQRRAERVLAQATKAAALFSGVELAAIEGEIEALRANKPASKEFHASAMSRGRIEVPKDNVAEGPAGGHIDLGSAAREREAAHQDERVARLWTLERNVLERSMGYGATAARGEL